MKIITIIPARGGSKGIPDKNIADVAGKPLIVHTIEPALRIKEKGLTDHIVVSTDSEKIAEVALKAGAEVPFLRPKEISGDRSKSIEFMQHAIQHFHEKGISFDAALLLQPTSPLRTENDIINAVEMFRNADNDSLISGYEEEYINDLVLYRLDKDGKTTIPLSPDHNKGIRRQEHGSVYVRNGCMYISSIELIQKGFIIGEKPLLYKMEKNRSVNVDTWADLELLRKMI